MFNGDFFGTTQVSRYQKGKTTLSHARDRILILGLGLKAQFLRLGLGLDCSGLGRNHIRPSAIAYK